MFALLLGVAVPTPVSAQNGNSAARQEDSLEWIMTGTGSPILFMDFLTQERVPGNAWMFQLTSQREWGQNPPFRMVARNQYDGVLFIESVRAPSYTRQF